MPESNDLAHYDTLQVSPTAEPEVIAAAYRALAKKYHPDRSPAPDAMVRMARINGAFQALRSRSGRVTADDSAIEPPATPPSRLSQERVNPNAPLEEILAAITRMVLAARQHVIDEVSSDGVPRDVATSLVAAALRTFTSGAPDSRKARAGAGQSQFDPAASYDDALRAVAQRAQVIRDQLTDDLVKDGLNRATALELADMAFERVRRKTRTPVNSEVRLTAERVDLTGPLDAGVRVVAAKVHAARQMVIDELTRDGIPLRTADQLVEAATEAATGPKGRASR